ncbi:MAG TPA: hypothetical protein VKA60_20495 [Blastocatellia bacterium]|nr:hypothetical protein [Blastocatellia bacterium]
MRFTTRVSKPWQLRRLAGHDAGLLITAFYFATVGAARTCGG